MIKEFLKSTLIPLAQLKKYFPFNTNLNNLNSYFLNAMPYNIFFLIPYVLVILVVPH